MYSTEGLYIIKKLEIRIFIFVLRASTWNIKRSVKIGGVDVISFHVQV